MRRLKSEIILAILDRGCCAVTALDTGYMRKRICISREILML